MSQLKIMTWNVENLFRPGEEGGPSKETDYREKLETLARVILDLNPDILAVQEIGSTGAFGDLRDSLQGRFSHHLLSSHPDPRGIRVGFLSRLPIIDSEDRVGFPAVGIPRVPGVDGLGNLVEVTSLSRGALRITVDLGPNRRAHFVTAHFKSKLLSYPSGSGRSRFEPRDEDERARVGGVALMRRAGEAVALRTDANRLLEGTTRQPLIVLGDLNDVVDAATTQILQGPGGSELGTAGFDRPDKGDDSRLFNLAPLIPAERRFSRVYRGGGELIDHIFASEEWFPGDPRTLPVVDSHVQILGGLPSINDDPGERRGKPGSDHAPITATFTV